jgi:hypothetical protein
MNDAAKGDSGHCLCGTVRWESDGTRSWSCYCHCASCRRQCAAPVTAYVGVPDGRWTWVGDPPATFASAAGVTRHFCARCGTPMAYEAGEFPGEIHFYAATLDDPTRFEPAYHVHHAERVPWMIVDDALPRHPRGGESGAE